MVVRRKISGPGRLGSIREVKKSLKSKGGKTRTIPSEDSITVRFLDEPEDFYGFYQHWFKDGPKPCVEGDCAGCNDDNPDVRRKAFRYLANAYVIDDQKVQPVELPKSLVEQLVAYFEKKGTLLDRDYELSKTGSGMTDTKYMASPESPMKMNISRFKKLDLDKVLSSMLDDDDEDDEDDEDEDDEPVTRRSSRSSKTTTRRKIKEDDDNPWDDEDEEDEDETPVRRKVRPTVKKARTTPARRTTRRTTR